MSYDDFFGDYMAEDLTGGFDEEDSLDDRFDRSVFFDEDGYDLEDADCNGNYTDEDYIPLNLEISFGPIEYENADESDEGKDLTEEQIAFRKEHFTDHGYPDIKDFVRENYPQIKLSKSEPWRLSEAFFRKTVKKQPEFAFKLWKDILKHYPVDIIGHSASHITDDFIEDACAWQSEMLIEEMKNDEWFFNELLVKNKSSIFWGRKYLLSSALEKEEYDFFMRVYNITKQQFIDLCDTDFTINYNTFEDFMQGFIEHAWCYAKGRKGIEFLKSIRDDQNDEELKESFNDRIDNLEDELKEDENEYDNCSGQKLTEEQIAFRKEHFTDDNFPDVKDFVSENYPQIKISKSSYFDLSTAFFCKTVKKQPELAFKLWKDILKHYPVDIIGHSASHITDDFIEDACAWQSEMLIEEMKNDEWFFNELLVKNKSSIYWGRKHLLSIALEKEDYDFFMRVYNITKQQFVDLQDTDFTENYNTFEDFMLEFIGDSWCNVNGRKGIEFLKSIRDDQNDEELKETFNDYIEDLEEDLRGEEEYCSQTEELIQKEYNTRCENSMLNRMLDLLIDNKPYETYVAGIKFLKDKSVIDDAKINAILTFEREPNNKYDSNAVIIFLNNKKLGYIPKDNSQSIARLLDANKQLSGKITGLHMGRNYTRIQIEITIV